MNLLELSAAIRDRLRHGKPISADDLKEMVAALGAPLSSISKTLSKARLSPAVSRQLAGKLALLCHTVGNLERSVAQATEGADAEFAERVDQAAREKRLLQSPTGRGILSETEAGRELLRQQRFAKR